MIDHASHARFGGLLTLVLAACGGSDAPSDGATPDGGPDAGPPPDPIALAAEIDEDELRATIEDLQALGTRYTFSSGDEQARDYLVDRLEAYGLAPELDPFLVDTEQAHNVIARKPGVADDVVFLFSAHYDSTSTEPMTDAPGADDNATGVAAVLEAARILAPLSFRHSLWFAFTAAEEQGSLGSAHMVGWLADEAVDLRGVIAPDMIGYWPLHDDDLMDILGDDDSAHLVAAMAGFADALGVAHKDWIRHDYCYGDDHTNFQEAGFPAISPMDCVEAHNLPASGEDTVHYHQTTDRDDTLYLPFATRVVGVIVATLADLGEPVSVR